MSSILSVAGVSKQGHQQALNRIEEQAQKSCLYLNLITEVRETHPGMGLRTIYEKWQPDGIGRDAFIDLGIRFGFLVEPIPTAPRTTIPHPSANYPNLLKECEFTDVNQLWSSDITFFLLKEKWYYLTFILDVYSRRIVGYTVSDNMRAYNNANALQMAFDLRNISNYNKELIHHSDRGSQYISNLYTDLLRSFGVRISMCTNVLENSHIERINGTIKNQYLKHWSINNFNQLKKCLDKAVWAYNYEKPHESLNGKSPVEFENFIKELPLEKRTKMKVFVYQQNNDKKIPNQLTFSF